MGCPRNEYSFESGSLTNLNSNSCPSCKVECLPCPDECDCGGGDAVAAKEGFWAWEKALSQTSVAPCPAGLCANASSSNGFINQCEGSRDPSVPLCGACMPGLS